MKRLVKRFLKVTVLLNAMFFVLGVAQATTLRIPAGTKVIEKEAFYGDKSIDEVILPKGIEFIGERAFGNTGIRKINLPESLSEIAYNALDFDESMQIDVKDGSYASDWLIQRKKFLLRVNLDESDYFGEAGDQILISATSDPEDAAITSIVWKDQTGRIVSSGHKDCLYTVKPEKDTLTVIMTDSKGHQASKTCNIKSAGEKVKGPAVQLVGVDEFHRPFELGNTIKRGTMTYAKIDKEYYAGKTIEININGEYSSTFSAENFPVFFVADSWEYVNEFKTNFYIVENGKRERELGVNPANILRFSNNYEEYEEIPLGTNIARAKQLSDIEWRITVDVPSNTHWIAKSWDFASITSSAGVGPASFIAYAPSSNETEEEMKYSIYFSYFRNSDEQYDEIANNAMLYGERLVQKLDITQSPLSKYTVNANNDEISGVIKTASGEPVSNIDVCIRDSNGDIVGFTSSKSNGSWTIDGLTAGQAYQVYYGSMTYQVSGNGDSVITGTYLNGIATIYGQQDSTLSFTMKQNNDPVTSIQVGTTVDFTVTAPNAEYVRLIVDDKEYEAHRVENGTAEFSRIFSSKGSGTRKIQVQSYTNEDGWKGISEAQNLHISEVGKLRAFQLSCPSVSIKNRSIDISWVNNDSHAQYYSVYVFGPGGTQIYPDWRNTSEEINNPVSSRTIPADTFSYKGTYSIQVVATGVGYGSVTVCKDVEVKDTDLAVELTLASNVDPSNIGIGDSVHFNISTSFSVEDPTYELISSDTENSVVNGANVRFKKAQKYTLTAKMKYNGEEYTSNEISVNVNAPSVEFTAEAIEDGMKKKYSQYLWKLIDTEVEFTLKPNFTPTLITVKKGAKSLNAQIIEKKSEHEYTAKISLSTANIKEEYKFTLTDCNGKSYGPYCIPIYVMEQNPEKGKTFYVNKEVCLYKKPDLQSSINVPKGTPVNILEGKYANTFSLISYLGNEYFVKNDDISGLKETVPTGIDSITSTAGITLSDRHIVYNETEITYTIMTHGDIEAMNAYIEHFPAYEFHNDEVFIDETPAPCERDPVNQNKFTFKKKFSKTGIYKIFFRSTKQVPLDDTINIYPVRWAPDVISIDTSNQGNIKYLKKEEQGPLLVLPDSKYMNGNSGTVRWDQPLSVLGTVGDSYYVSSKDINGKKITGFIRERNTSNEKNPSETRAYILLFKPQWTQDGRAKSNSADIEKAIFLFRKAGCTKDSIFTYEGAVKADLNHVLATLSTKSDFNDVTYLYLESHGNDGFIATNGTHECATETYDYADLASAIVTNTHGEVKLFIMACMSGSFVSAAKKVEKWDKKRISVITSSAEGQKSMSDIIFNTGYPYTNQLGLYYEIIDNDHNDGGLTIKEMKKIWVTSTDLGVFVWYAFPQYYGDESNIVFHKNYK